MLRVSYVAYFTTIFYLARNISADTQPAVDKDGSAIAGSTSGGIQASDDILQLTSTQRTLHT
jgi:hypothetical protein